MFYTWQAINILNGVREEFMRRLPDVPWMDEMSQKNASIKATHVNPKIGYPDLIMHVDKLDEKYDKVSECLHHEVCFVKLPSDECYKILLIISHQGGGCSIYGKLGIGEKKKKMNQCTKVQVMGKCCQARLQYKLRSRQNGHHLADDIFKQIFLNQKSFTLKFTKIYSQGSNHQYASIGSDNGLVPNRQLAIIWTVAGLVYWCIYESLGLIH